MRTAALRIEDLPEYTYDDYVQWEGRWEVIQGIPYAMTPSPNIIHQKINTNIVWQLKNLLKTCRKCEVLMPVDWPVFDDTVVQPDALVVCHDRSDIGIEKLEVTPVMVFEVLSPSTSRKDRGIKYRLYEQAGVKYYCIVDPETKSSEVYVMKKDKYDRETGFKEGQMQFDLGLCQIAFDFGEIFS
ncbi:MAG: Uma2 family endonuclease [Candidatus Aminicenantes bacterium]|nr:Uma2 family endonuclease [Candidatus Aminicenantes bacterium]